MIPKLTDTYS